MFICFTVNGKNNSLLISAIIKHLSELLPCSTFIKDNSESYYLETVKQERIGYIMENWLYIDSIGVKRLLDNIITNMNMSQSIKVNVSMYY